MHHDHATFGSGLDHGLHVATGKTVRNPLNTCQHLVKIVQCLERRMGISPEALS